MKYLLDTNICIYVIKQKPLSVLKKFSKVKEGSIAISSATVAELYYGIFKSAKPNENTIALEQFLAPLVILNFNKDDSFEYGKIRADRRNGFINSLASRKQKLNSCH